MLPKITDQISDVDFLIDKKDYKNAIKKQFIPHLEKIYPTNSRKTSTFALVKQTLSQRCLELNII